MNVIGGASFYCKPIAYALLWNSVSDDPLEFHSASCYAVLVLLLTANEMRISS